MKTNSSDSKKRHISARAKLVPAVAMLSTSAIMLSTSTYAWFTMNKEVEITGLQMTATASDGLEVSLGKITSSNGVNSVSMPGDDANSDKYWSNSFAVSNFYDKIGRIQPASSIDGNSFFYATDATSQGREANTFAAVDSSQKVKTVLLDDVNKSDDTIAIYEPASGETYEPGYYLDIPFYMRTRKPAATEGSNDTLYAAVKITDASEKTPEETLYKAVRVAIIGKNNSGNDTQSSIFSEETSADYYEAKAVKEANDGGTKKRSQVLDDVNLIPVANAYKGTSTGLRFTKDKYMNNNVTSEFRKEEYIIRVWLEGESKSCFDANSGQAWNIDLKFGLSEADITDFTAAANGNNQQGGNNNGQPTP